MSGSPRNCRSTYKDEKPIREEGRKKEEEGEGWPQEISRKITES
jgi:hypothetical protein